MKTLFFLIIPAFAFGQTSFNGNIINKRTKEKIPFVSVGLMKENVGTNADENGDFILESKSSKSNDTLIFSSIGFETLKLPVKATKELRIELDEKSVVLSEVIVGNRTWTKATLNDFDKCGTLFVTTQGFLVQLALHFTLPEESGILTEVKICRSGGFFEPEKAMFRIRVYDIDTVTKTPSIDLCDKVIEVKTGNRYVHLNLEKYKIRIPNRDFFVAVEWIKIPFNERKEKLEINGQKSEITTYKPSLGTVEVKDKTFEAWFIDYKNKWRRWTSWEKYRNRVPAISATVKF